jgi:hypothetical protein
MSLDLQSALAMLDKQTRQLFIQVRKERERLSFTKAKIGEDVQSGKNKTS